MITKFRGEEYIMHRYGDGPIITIDNFPVPSKQVFNCAQTMYEGKTVLLVAAIYEKPNKYGNGSGIHVAMSEDGINFDINPEPLCQTRDWTGNKVLEVTDGWVIDPRITKIDDTYYIVRPAQMGTVGPAAIIEKTKDFKSVEFVECVALPSNRVPCLFPEKINGMYMKIDRPYNPCRIDESKGGDKLDDVWRAGMWVSYSPDMIYWGKYRPLFYPCLSFANYKVGPTPPIKTKEGWLEIIHGVYKENREWCYALGAILLDLEDPSRVTHAIDKSILTPNRPYEIEGASPNTIFSCGAIVDEELDRIRIYYGAADKSIGLATGSLSELLSELKKNPVKF